MYPLYTPHIITIPYTLNFHFIFHFLFHLVTPLTAAELTQAFLAHEDQLSIIQAQTTIVFKLPAEGSIARALLAAVQGWQRDHHPGQAHPHGSCNQAVCTVLLHELAKSAVPTGLSQDSFQSFSEMAAELASQKTPAAWVGEISRCSARANAKKTHVILDLRPVLFGSIAKHADTIIKLLESYEGERLGRKPPGGLTRRARGRPSDSSGTA